METHETTSLTKTHGTAPSLPSKILVGLLIVASLLVIVTLGLGLLPRTKHLVKTDQYQAVFLTNGQVYFGKLSSVNSDYLVLKNIYYLQQQDQQVQQPTDPNKSNVSLVKLGSELHGPEDEMFVQQDKILFWENLKNDGKVAQAIKQQSSKQ